jgi:hypothetical protein
MSEVGGILKWDVGLFQKSEIRSPKSDAWGILKSDVGLFLRSDVGATAGPGLRPHSRAAAGRDHATLAVAPASDF